MGVRKHAKIEPTHEWELLIPLFELQDVLGDTGWLKAIEVEAYAPRRSRPLALQEVLFSYLDAV